jgi:chaperonin GroES
MSSVNIKPLADRILVEPAAAEERTASGIIIPDTAKEKPQRGKVVAVGAGKVSEKGEVIASQLKVGDTVLYGKYSGTELTIDGKEYLIMKESDIFAVV